MNSALIFYSLHQNVNYDFITNIFGYHNFAISAKNYAKLTSNKTKYVINISFNQDEDVNINEEFNKLHYSTVKEQHINLKKNSKSLYRVIIISNSLANKPDTLKNILKKYHKKYKYVRDVQIIDALQQKNDLIIPNFYLFSNFDNNVFNNYEKNKIIFFNDNYKNTEIIYYSTNLFLSKIEFDILEFINVEINMNNNKINENIQSMNNILLSVSTFNNSYINNIINDLSMNYVLFIDFKQNFINEIIGVDLNMYSKVYDKYILELQTLFESIKIENYNKCLEKYNSYYYFKYYYKTYFLNNININKKLENLCGLQTNFIDKIYEQIENLIKINVSNYNLQVLEFTKIIQNDVKKDEILHLDRLYNKIYPNKKYDEDINEFIIENNSITNRIFKLTTIKTNYFNSKFPDDERTKIDDEDFRPTKIIKIN